MKLFLIVLLSCLTVFSFGFYFANTQPEYPPFPEPENQERENERWCLNFDGKKIECPKPPKKRFVEYDLKQIELEKKENLAKDKFRRFKYFGKKISNKILQIIQSKDLSTYDALESINIFETVFVLLEKGFVSQGRAELITISLTKNTINQHEKNQLLREINFFLGIKE